MLLAELAEIIGRGKFTRRIQRAGLSASGLSASGLVEDCRRLAVLAEPQPLTAPVSRDPDDDHVLACALAASASLIVSGDRDLLTLGSFEDIPIRTAGAALERLAAALR